MSQWQFSLLSCVFFFRIQFLIWFNLISSHAHWLHIEISRPSQPKPHFGGRFYRKFQWLSNNFIWHDVQQTWTVHKANENGVHFSCVHVTFFFCSCPPVFIIDTTSSDYTNDRQPPTSNGVKTIIAMPLIWQTESSSAHAENVIQTTAHCQSMFAMDMINWTEVGQNWAFNIS